MWFKIELPKVDHIVGNTPYRKRMVFDISGSNDGLGMTSMASSRRVTASGALQLYGVNEIGHQGLMHEGEAILVYNRARHLHVDIGRFMQKDPLGYVDDLSMYAY